MYYYEENGQQAGPIASDQLRAHGVQAMTLVWKEGMTDWATAESVPELHAYFVTPPPVVPLPASIANPARVKRPEPTVPPVRSPFGIWLKLSSLVVASVWCWHEWTAPPNQAVATHQKGRKATKVRVGEDGEEIKEIGYAANHLHDKEPAVNTSAVRKAAREDAIEDIDNNNGWLTVHYESGTSRSFGIEKEWFFAYSSQLIVTHNDRVSCQVRDIYGNQITNGTTRNDGAACTGLRVVGDHIILDVDTGHSTRQETYDKELRLLRTSNVHLY